MLAHNPRKLQNQMDNLSNRCVLEVLLPHLGLCLGRLLLKVANVPHDLIACHIQDYHCGEHLGSANTRFVSKESAQLVQRLPHILPTLGVERTARLHCRNGKVSECFFDLVQLGGALVVDDCIVDFHVGAHGFVTKNGRYKSLHKCLAQQLVCVGILKLSGADRVHEKNPLGDLVHRQCIRKHIFADGRRRQLIGCRQESQDIVLSQRIRRSMQPCVHCLHAQNGARDGFAQREKVILQLAKRDVIVVHPLRESRKVGLVVRVLKLVHRCKCARNQLAILNPTDQNKRRNVRRHQLQQCLCHLKILRHIERVHSRGEARQKIDCDIAEFKGIDEGKVMRLECLNNLTASRLHRRAVQLYNIELRKLL
eukprot:Opistho-2@35034